jgi:hypothetical protein
MHAKFAYTEPGQPYVLAYDYHGDADYNYYAAPALELHGTVAPSRTIAEAHDHIFTALTSTHWLQIVSA